MTDQHRGRGRGRPVKTLSSDILAALHGANGVVALAARALGVTTSGIWRRVKAEPALLAALDVARSNPRPLQRCDFCEGRGVILTPASPPTPTPTPTES